MQKPLLRIACLATVMLLAGCASTPEPEAVAPQIPQTLLGQLENLSSQILEAGGLAAVGTGKSKSFELAQNWAKVNGRLTLQQILDDKMQTLRQAFAEESGTPQKAQNLDAFGTAAQTIKEQIQDSAPKELTHETIDGTVNAYALMEISPQQILDQLRKEKDLYPRFIASETFKTLETEIQTYENFKNAPTNAPAAQ
jgi:hypothetical protein